MVLYSGLDHPLRRGVGIENLSSSPIITLIKEKHNLIPMDPSLVLRKVTKLHVDRNPSRYTVGKAPHKPILLLALIVLNKNNRIDLSNIKPSLDLRQTREDLWGSLDHPEAGQTFDPEYDHFLMIAPLALSTKVLYKVPLPSSPSMKE